MLPPPRVMEVMQQVWFSMALLLLLLFAFRITLITADEFGALPAAIAFFVVLSSVIYSVVYATSRPDSPRRF